MVKVQAKIFQENGIYQFLEGNVKKAMLSHQTRLCFSVNLANPTIKGAPGLQDSPQAKVALISYLATSHRGYNHSNKEKVYDTTLKPGG